jgi:FxsC-like protein
MAGDRAQPYFFLSYARNPYRPADGPAPDGWVKSFYMDLQARVATLVKTQVPGFMDLQTPLGEVWRDTLGHAVSTCSVFVPVLTEGYFESDWTGKELTAFVERARRALDDPRKAIVPVLWLPYERYPDFPFFGEQQLTLPSFTGALPNTARLYRENGMADLIYLRQAKSRAVAYRDAVNQIAQMIRLARLTTLLPAGQLPDWDMVPSMWDTLGSTRHDALSAPLRKVRVVMAVYPYGRDQVQGSGGGGVLCRPARLNGKAYYGSRDRDWMPYPDSDDGKLIAACAKDVIEELRYYPVLDPLDERSAESEPLAAPTVMLVDPWAAGHPHRTGQLRDIDEDPVPVIIPWNEDDAETVSWEPVLDPNLKERLTNCLKLPDSRHRVLSLAEFRAEFPDVVERTVAKYFGKIRIPPAAGQSPPRRRGYLRPTNLNGGDGE